MTDLEYLMTHVEVEGDCWIWQQAPDAYGYGRVRRHMKRYKAHRWVYELLVGPIPDGMTIDHLCRVRMCVNPDHLEPVTSAVNTYRGQHRAVCKYGHYTPGPEKCKVCGNRRVREYRLRKKEASLA